MENVLVAIAVLACPIGMGLMMFFMARGMRGGDRDRPRETAPQDVDSLREEHRRLGAEIERLEGTSSVDDDVSPRPAQHAPH